MKQPMPACVLMGGAALVLAVLAPPLGAQVYPKRGLYDESTGLLQSKIGSSWFRGSGVIARDPRLIYSCAHVLYENGIWASSYSFHRAYHSRSGPYSGDGASPRGFRYFTSYASNTGSYGGTSPEAYAYDFVVLYGTSDFGKAVGWWTDGGAVLRSNRWKRIIGYPSRLAYTGTDGGHYQHATDWFSHEASQSFGAYHRLNGVSTGKGNSGGPVFVWDQESEEQFLAGILVSGDATLSGIHALGTATHDMASAALGLEKITRTFSNTSALRLSDGAASFTNRSATASGFSEDLTTLKCSVRIHTPRRGDLAVFLRSPGGRTRWILKPANDSRDHLVVNRADYSTTFAGTAANGTWTLRMRDATRRNRADFKSFAVSVTALGEP